VKALRPQTKVFAVEIETGAPLGPALAAGKPVEVPFTPNFVDGIGTPFVNLEMFELAQKLVDGSLIVDKPKTAAALKLVVERNRVVPEGAAATSVAAALSGVAGSGKIVAVLSGGNIDVNTLTTILQGGVP
jgi:threonine dehydratase